MDTSSRQRNHIVSSKQLNAKVPNIKYIKYQSFDLKLFWHQLQNLDMQNYGSWPMAIKVCVIILLLFLIAALTYGIPISSKLDEIAAAEADQQVLIERYRVKEYKARHFDAYVAQVSQMEIEFIKLLDRLPKETRVSDLVDSINKTGVESGVRFQDISIEADIEQALFIEQPIRITAVGHYHQFGSFISGLAALPRIITLNDFEVTNSMPSLETLPELTLVLNTKTYRAKQVASVMQLKLVTSSVQKSE